MRLPRPLALVVPLGALCGCFSSNGEFENGSFRYECIGPTDAACSVVGRQPGGTGSQEPPLVAVGAAFGLHYADAAGTEGGVQLQPASEQVLQPTSGGFTVLVPGPTTVLARGPRGNVVDMFHLEARSVADLLVFPLHRTRDARGVTVMLPPEDGQPVPGLVLACGGCEEKPQATLLVAPVGNRTAILGGALEYGWSVRPEGVVRITVGSATNAAILQVLAAGSATVSIETGGVVRELPVLVEE